MLRKYVALCLVVLLWMTGCAKQESVATVTVSDVTPTGLVCRVTATEDLQTGRDYALDVFEDGTWQAVPALTEPIFTTVAYLLSPDTPFSETINWEHLYGTLSSGHYRIVKTIHRYRAPGDFDAFSVYGEFDIT